MKKINFNYIFISVLLPLVASGNEEGDFRGCKGISIGKKKNSVTIDAQKEFLNISERVKKICSSNQSDGKNLLSRMSRARKMGDQCLKVAVDGEGQAYELSSLEKSILRACDTLKADLKNTNQYCLIRGEILSDAQKISAPESASATDIGNLSFDDAENSISSQIEPLKKAKKEFEFWRDYLVQMRSKADRLKENILNSLPEGARAIDPASTSPYTKDKETEKRVRGLQRYFAQQARNPKNPDARSCRSLAANDGDPSAILDILEASLWPNAKRIVRVLDEMKKDDALKIAELEVNMSKTDAAIATLNIDGK